ncbi:hypothetical protein B0H14DRAFT_2641372 [Mycena olivaceomarginata]|nr:hypothetical protein B0H14DRAFT_2641372 [Mycena olivaceomarginata]
MLLRLRCLHRPVLVLVLMLLALVLDIHLAQKGVVCDTGVWCDPCGQSAWAGMTGRQRRRTRRACERGVGADDGGASEGGDEGGHTDEEAQHCTAVDDWATHAGSEWTGPGPAFDMRHQEHDGEGGYKGRYNGSSWTDTGLGAGGRKGAEDSEVQRGGSTEAGTCAGPWWTPQTQCARQMACAKQPGGRARCAWCGSNGPRRAGKRAAGRATLTNSAFKAVARVGAKKGASHIPTTCLSPRFPLPEGQGQRRVDDVAVRMNDLLGGVHNGHAHGDAEVLPHSTISIRRTMEALTDDGAIGVDASTGVDEGRERGCRRRSYGCVMFADGLGIGDGRETGATEGADDRGADEGTSEARTTGL